MNLLCHAFRSKSEVPSSSELRRVLTLVLVGLFLVVVASLCLSADRAVGESLTIPVPEGVRIRAKNPHEMHESHELSWHSKTTGTARGILHEDPKQKDVSQMRRVLEDMMTREKERNAYMKIPDGKYSAIESAPLRRGPWKEALWYTYEGGIYPPSQQTEESIETKPPFYVLKMALWTGRRCGSPASVPGTRHTSRSGWRFWKAPNSVRRCRRAGRRRKDSEQSRLPNPTRSHRLRSGRGV